MWMPERQVRGLGSKETYMFAKIALGLFALTMVAAASLTPAESANTKRYVGRSGWLPSPAYGARKDGRAHSSNPASDVYLHGKYSGSDPDPFIRGSLARDPPWNS